MLSAFPPAAVWGIINYLWNTGTGAPLSAWTIVIVFYYPIQLWYSRYSAINVLVGVVGAVGLSARCCMGEMNHLWNNDGGEALYFFSRPTICDLISNLRNVLNIKLVIYLK